jgi:hypothetical protein
MNKTSIRPSPKVVAGWKARFLSERSMTVIFGMFCILSVVFALWALHRSGVSMKRVESMNHTLADLMVKRHEESQRQTPAIIAPEVKVPPAVEKSITDLKRKTEEMAKIQMDKKVNFDNIIKARQSEISKIANLENIQNHLRDTVSDIHRETASTRLDVEMIRHEITPAPIFSSTPAFSSIVRVEEIREENEEMVDEEELLRDLRLLEEST